MKVRKIVVIDFMESGPVQISETQIGNVRFELTEHKIGWNLELAVSLVERYDGEVDGISLSGLPKRLEAGKTRILYPGYWKLLRAAKETPLYSGDEIRSFFARWTLDRVMKQEPRFFSGKKVLFHCGAATDYAESVSNAGAKLEFADLNLIAGAPLRLKSLGQLEKVLKRLSPLVKTLGPRIDPLLGMKKECSSLGGARTRRLERWISENDIFFTFGSLLSHFESLEALKGKIVFLDYLPEEQAARLKAAGPAQIITFLPDLPILELFRHKSFSVGAAALDILRALDAPTLTLEEYLLRLIQKYSVEPSALLTNRGVKRRCAFVVHPLSNADFFRLPMLKKSRKLIPGTVVRAIERGASRLPVYHYGTITGIRSDHDGQEVECDLYGFLATPKQLLSMDEHFVYDRLVQAADLAAARGSALMGLGAYTKVVGDGGVTVHKRSPIPVTTGNSYTVATSLWASRVMVEKIGLFPKERVGNRFKATAVIVGATGAIGRVSALLVGLIFQRVVLVAPRVDRLLEVQAELKAHYPEIDVVVTTDASTEVGRADLIVTATSNVGGKSLFEMSKVKPGAVICDCSRPLDITKEEALSRPDVLVIHSGEVELPGSIKIDADIGLPRPAVYACLAETVLLTLEGRYEPFTSGKRLSIERVKEIYQMGTKHGARLAAIRGHFGVITDEQVAQVRERALERLQREEHKNEVSTHV